MNIKKIAGIAILSLVFVMGCAGSYQQLKTQPVGEANITHQDLIDDWSDYAISYRQINGRLVVIVFDPQHDNRTIVAESPWRTINGQTTWTEILKANTDDDGNFSLKGGYYPPTITIKTTGVRQINSLDNRFFGYIIFQERREYVQARMLDENSMRIVWSPPRSGSPAK